MFNGDPPENEGRMVLGPPIKKESLQKLAYRRIRKGILMRKIKPGEHIKISDLAGGFRVSTIPVREALRQLETEGMITFGPHKRIVVNRLSIQDLHDIYRMLIPLEEIALKKCFERVDEVGLKDLNDIQQQMAGCGGRIPEWVEFNWLFHRRISELASSPYLARILSSLRNSIRPYLFLSFEERTRINEVNREHALILEAICERSWEKGKEACRMHLQNGCRAVEVLLKKEYGHQESIPSPF